MNAERRAELYKALLGPAKLDASLAARELADMTHQDVERLAPVIDQIELEAYKAGYGAGLRQGVRVTKRPRGLEHAGAEKLRKIVSGQ